MKKMDVKALALSVGIVWGASTLIIGLGATWFGTYTDVVEFMGRGYKGFDATVGGSIIGGIWGFVDAAIGGLLVAWLYNKFAKKK